MADGLRQDGAEVGVGRDQDAFLASPELKDLRVARPLHTPVPNVHDVVARSGERLGEVR